MQHLRFIERRDRVLVFESDAGVEFRFEVDDEFIDAVRAIPRARQPRAVANISPRNIQALLRSGASRAAIVEQLGVEEADVERYEGPILAEFQYMLSSAKQVPVRTTPNAEGEPQTFGDVIEERLHQLSARDRAWSAWKHEEDGWMVQVEFDSHGSLHTAIWSFDHRKGLLNPITPDAVNLSKQGDVGDKLIPTLRVVDRVEEPTTFDAAVFDSSDAQSPDDDADEGLADDEHPFISPPADDDFARRQEIEQRAIAMDTSSPEDLGQTADLLEALRRRRSTRESAPDQATDDEQHGDTSNATLTTDDVPREPRVDQEPRSRKGRASIPSWDDILFGTRSDED